MAKYKIPLTLITGYLGAGKTTFLNKILQNSSLRQNVAVFVNDFGAVGLDGALLSQGQGTPVVELANGCICCVLSSDFTKSLVDFVQVYPKTEHVFVEASGAVDPASIVRLFWTNPDLSKCFELNSVICVLDARMLGSVNTLSSGDQVLIRAQASVADAIYFSKLEYLSETESVKAQAQLWAPWAIDLGSFDHAFATLWELKAYSVPRFENASYELIPAHGSLDALSSISIAFEGVLEPRSIQKFFQSLVLAKQGQVLRAKALFFVRPQGRTRRLVCWQVHLVQGWTEKQAGPKGYSGPNRLVVLGRGLDLSALQVELEALKQSAHATTASLLSQ